MLIEIWQPRYHDRVVLIAVHKVQDQNEIVFTKTPSIPSTARFKISGAEIRKYPMGTNGKIKCYEVPLDKLLN